MLTGIYTYSVDQKGRIVMPNRFLDEIGNPFVLGGHPSGYLVAASNPDLLESRNNVRAYAECRIKDRTGRFVIPSALRDFAELSGSGEAMVVGHGDEVEIWNKRRWDSVARLGNTPVRPAVDSPRAERREPAYRRTEPQTGYPPSGGSSQPLHQPAAQSPGWSRGSLPPAGYQPMPQGRQQSPFDRVSIQQKAIYGQPYLQVEGALGVNDTDKVIARLDTAVRGHPRTLFLDLRGVDTIDASLLAALGPISGELASHGGRLALITARQDIVALIEMLCPPTHTRVLPDFEAAMWWLVDEGHA